MKSNSPFISKFSNDLWNHKKSFVRSSQYNWNSFLSYLNSSPHNLINVLNVAICQERPLVPTASTINRIRQKIWRSTSRHKWQDRPIKGRQFHHMTIFQSFSSWRPIITQYNRTPTGSSKLHDIQYSVIMLSLLDKSEI